MKRAVILVLVLVLALSLAGCGQKTVEPDTIPLDESNQETIFIETPPPATPTPETTPPAVIVTPFPVPSTSPSPIPSQVTPETPTPSVTPAATAAPTTTDNFVGPTATEAEIAAGKAGYLSGDGVNLRAESNAQSRILDSFAYGTEFRILGYENGWAKVLVNGIVGYIAGNYVKEGKAPTTTTTTTTTTTNNNGNANVVVEAPNGNATVVTNNNGGYNAPSDPVVDEYGIASAVITFG